MNILYKTTTHVSIGDDIAFFGTKRVFDTVVPGHNAFVYSRSEKDAWKADLGIRIDLVVIAGTPIWSGRQMRGLEEFVIQNKKPIFYCGVGMNYEDNPSRDLALANAVGFIGRDNFAWKRARRRTDAVVYCCPSIFSVDASPTRGDKIGVILQVDTFPEKQMNLIKRWPKEDVVIICNEIIDYVWAEANLPGYDIVYSRVLKDMTQFYLRCKEIYSMRIHGAHLAYALGIPTVCIKNEKDKSVCVEKIGVKLVDPDKVTEADLACDQSIKARMYDDYIKYTSSRLAAAFPQLGIAAPHVTSDARDAVQQPPQAPAPVEAAQPQAAPAETEARAPAPAEAETRA
ncbi:polysaccharide pyruvyl transferase family protein [Methylosinus sp. Sm6]|uniref:polysaccharide pyruvyl transferase family protein n=1 Tax=Methylosinus sp. Sm6 TaxID=2866948 RepID=UPI001C997A8A|nr:polysaccharide pyruvyl transferase family protein [Methylosinus sp. Sm6]